MNDNELLDRYGLVPAQADLPEIRGLIRTLTADKARASNEPLKTLCIQLFSAGDPRDALVIYRAKRSSFDAGTGIDIQLVCGAGLEATESFVRDSGEPDASELLSYLRECKAAGDFEGFTRESVLDSYRRYFKISS